MIKLIVFLVRCQNQNELFEVTCSLDGFMIRINEACRRSFFPFIDFGSSFVWGDASKQSMDQPLGSFGTDVDSTFTGTCENVKLASVGSVDSDYSAAWYINVPLGNCGIEEVRKTNANTGNDYIEYSLYWNSQVSVNSPVAQLYQIGQIKMVCRLDPLQLDAASVSVYDTATIPEPSESQIDIRSALRLVVEKAKFEETVIDEYSLSPVALTSSTATNPVLSQPGIYYSEASTANIGDYMQLNLLDLSYGRQVLNSYA